MSSLDICFKMHILFFKKSVDNFEIVENMLIFD